MSNRWFSLLFVWVATDLGWFTRIVWDRCGHGWAYAMAFIGFGMLPGVLRWWMRRLVQHKPGPHPWREYNAYGNTCQEPGCALTEDEHLKEAEA